MRLSAVANCVAFASLLTLTGVANAAPPRVSGPLVHENLAVYFLHGPSQPGPVPLTLAEAMSAHLVVVHETGHVNSLQIENLGDQPVFVQAGDIVKGGKQDRTMAVSMLLPPKSGVVPIASFCVENGRWTKRGNENSQAFSSAMAAVPSLDMKIAAAVPAAEPSRVGSGGTIGLPGRVAALDTGTRQQKVWDGVRKMQRKLSANTGTDVRGAASQSSLQLALENKKLEEMRAAYIAALLPAGEKGDDIVGYVIAVNGKIESGDVYLSNGLFRKMWGKMLSAAATNAIGQRDDKNDAAPDVKAVEQFIAAADAGKSTETDVAFGLHRVLHTGDKAYLVEVAEKGGYLHRSYLAK